MLTLLQLRLSPSSHISPGPWTQDQRSPGFTNLPPITPATRFLPMRLIKWWTGLYKAHHDISRPSQLKHISPTPRPCFHMLQGPPPFLLSWPSSHWLPFFRCLSSTKLFKDTWSQRESAGDGVEITRKGQWECRIEQGDTGIPRLNTSPSNI